MAQKANIGSGKSKVIRSSNSLVPTQTKPKQPYPQNKSGNPNGNKRQAPSVTVS